MNQLRKADITAKLKRFLDRRSMPRALEGKPTAQADELAALVSVINRYAPQSLDQWWPDFEDDIGARNETRSWPSQGEVAASCKAITAPSVRRTVEANEIDTAAVWAGRIHGDGPVADFAVYGRFAVDMIRRGLVTEGDLTPWRSRLFFSEKDFYGEPEALRREAERKEAHRLAETLPGLSEKRRVLIPDLRSVPQVAE